MSFTTGSVRGFLEFDDLCRSRQGYSYNLAQLFDICEHDPLNRQKHNISFPQALDRLKQKIDDCFKQLGRSVTEFVIGKTFVKHKVGTAFNPMKPITWSLGGGIDGRWQDYEINGYDGLIALVCVEQDLIPEKVKEANRNAIEMNQQNYALALELALIEYFALIKTDKRLRNRSFDVDMASEEMHKGGIVYIAYKLEPTSSYGEDLLSRGIDLQSEATDPGIDRLKTYLEKRDLHFCCEISNDGNSFFQASSNQLDSLNIMTIDHIQLRQLVTGHMKGYIDDKIPDDYSPSKWSEYVNNISKQGVVVGDLVVEALASVFKRQIIIYYLNYPTDVTQININSSASNNGPPILLAREKQYYQSIKKKDDSEQKPHKKDTDVTTENTPKKRVSFGVNTNQPIKKIKQEETLSSTSPNPDPLLNPDDNKNETTESDKSPQNTVNESSLVTSAKKATVTATPTKDQPKPQGPKLVMTNDEKIHILKCFIHLDVKSDWDKLTEMVFNRRHGKVSTKTISHYEKLPKEKIKHRIQRYVNEAKKGKKIETDPEVKQLVEQIIQQKLAFGEESSRDGQ